MSYEEVFNNEGVRRFKITDENNVKRRVPHTWDDFPSVSRPDIEEWHADGLLHRVDGPARIVRCGYYQSPEDERGYVLAEWYTNGVLTKRVFSTDPDFKPEPVHVNTRNYEVAECSYEESSGRYGELERYKVFIENDVVVKVLHSFDWLPSRVFEERGYRYTYYHKNGVLHRENNLPALSIVNDIYETYSHTHYLNGVVHNGVLPAQYGSNGLIKYMVNGKLHRDGDAPAHISKDDKIREWWVNGKRHRAGGKPAVMWDNGDVEYWVDGVQLKTGACVIC